MKLIQLCTVFILLLFVTHLQAQRTETYMYKASEVVTLRSKRLNEERKIYIHVPTIDSADLNKRFPVLYLLDADNHFELLSQYAEYLSRTDVGVLPKLIIVGITNTNRVRDLTPTNSMYNYEGKPDTSSWLKASGGNDAFFEFLKTELIPFVDSAYNPQPYKLFAGHSFGGITTINCLLNQPDMFDAYIAVSPSFWWDKEYLLRIADQKLKMGTTLNKKLFYCNGNEGGQNSFFHKGLLKFDAILKKKNLLGLSRKYMYYPNEMHMTVPIIAYLDALRFVFPQEKKQ